VDHVVKTIIARIHSRALETELRLGFF
jgi:hypothetical protein